MHILSCPALARTLLLTAGLAATTANQAHSQSKFLGRWVVRYAHQAGGVHVQVGNAAPQLVLDSTRMTLRQRGDSIIGDWQAITPAGETVPKGRELRGVIRGDTLRMQLDPSIEESEGFFSELGREIVEFLKTHVHGIPPMTPYIEVTTRGDSLVGARWSASADFAAETPRRPLSAVRDKP